MSCKGTDVSRRQIALDTETTGLSVTEGHRVIEIGCVELVNRKLTGREFHRFVDPERDIDEGAERIHGISRADLDGKPTFADIVEEFLEFIRDSELIIHNAEFDVGFLNNELALLSHRQPEIVRHATVLDTLAMARNLHPGQRNSLDALCKRYGVDASARDVHGALIDAELLARVYLAMTGGQTALSLDAETNDLTGTATEQSPVPRRAGLSLVVRTANADEVERHEALLNEMERNGKCVWRSLVADNSLLSPDKT